MSADWQEIADQVQEQLEHESSKISHREPFMQQQGAYSADEMVSLLSE